MSHSLWLHKLQHARFLSPSLSPRDCSNSYPMSWWCHSTILSSAIPFFCLKSFPASESFLMNQVYASGDQIIGASASASILPMNVQDWFPSGFTGLMSLQSKELSRVFSKTTVQKHQFFSSPSSLWSSSHIHIWLLDYWKNNSFDYTDMKHN